MLQKFSDWKCTYIKLQQLSQGHGDFLSFSSSRALSLPVSEVPASVQTKKASLSIVCLPKSVHIPLKHVSLHSPLRDLSVGMRDYPVLIPCPWNTMQGYSLSFVWTNEIIFSRGSLFARQLIILESPLPCSHVALVTAFISNGDTGLRRNHLWTHPLCLCCWIWDLQLT